MDRLLYKYYIFWIMHFCTHLLNSCFIFLFLCIRITIVTLWLDHIRKIQPSFSSRVCALKKFGPQETEIPKFWPWRVLLWLQLPERLLVANILSSPLPHNLCDKAVRQLSIFIRRQNAYNFPCGLQHTNAWKSNSLGWNVEKFSFYVGAKLCVVLHCTWLVMLNTSQPL